MNKPRYNGPTRLTFEEWWRWEAKRRAQGKPPSTRRIVHDCLCGKKNVDPQYHRCPTHDAHPVSGLYDRIVVTL